MFERDDRVDIEELLKLVVDSGASDLHMKVGRPPVLRIDGALIAQGHMPDLSPQGIYQVIDDITIEEQRDDFSRHLDIDFALSRSGVGRFRVSLSLQRGTPAVAIRLVPTNPPTIERMRLPEVCRTLALKENGLVLVTGPSGSGKSTTLAAMIEHINNSVSRRIITIEDPIEVLHADKMCFVSQREVGADALSFANALKYALRQDPDIIMVGEMRDVETIATALTAAETGHLVLATLHAPGAAKAIDRVIDSFPPHQQQQVRMQLSTTLQGVLYQVLMPAADGQGRIVAVEVMIATDAVKNLVREAQTPQMVSVMQTGSHHGMQTLDQAILGLYRRGLINREEAIGRCRDSETTRKALGDFRGM